MSKILMPDTAFSKPLQRRPRVKAPKHLDFIRQLPCLVCKVPNETQAAHLRSACPELGKRATGMAEKPDDVWTLPLCGDCHLTGPDAQHRRNEMDWWNDLGIDPFPLALALHLYSTRGDIETATEIVMRTTVMRKERA